MLSVVTIWKQSPLLRILVPLMAGIIGYHIFPFPLYISCIFLLVGFSCWIIISIMNMAYQFRYGYWRSLGIWLVSIAGGMLISYEYNLQHHSDWYGHIANDSSKIILKIAEPPVAKPRTYKAIASVEYIVKNHSLQPVSGKIIAYFSQDSSAGTLQYGDLVEVLNVLGNIRNSGNPGGFDYQSYCARQNIFQQAFFQPDQWKLLPRSSTHDVYYYLFRARHYCLNVIKKYIPGKQEAGVAEALLLGYRDNLDKSLVQSYADAGVVHIIAISGLHLGLIYLILLWLFKPLNENTRISRWLKCILILAVLWAFALLTGARPPVLRTAVMFSMITTGKLLLNRPATTYNALFASAFLLLCYNPMLLFDVGFQLSYLAVLSIIAFHRSLYALMHFRWRLLDKLWQLATVSVVAQVLTWPVTLYYFHQFPLLFFISNIFIVPLASIVLIALILLIIISWWKWAAIWTGKLILVGISWMNVVVFRLSDYGWSRVTGIGISWTETILCYSIIVFILIWMFRKQRKALLLVSFAVLILIVHLSLKEYQALKNKKIIVLNIAPYEAVEYVDGDQIYFCGDSVILNDKLIFRRQLLPANTQLQAAITVPKCRHFYQHHSITQFYNKKLLVIDSTFSNHAAYPVQVNYLILSHNPSVNIREITRWYRFDTIIFDASNQWWKIREWKNECEQLNLPHFSVPDQGAFITDL